MCSADGRTPELRVEVEVVKRVLILVEGQSEEAFVGRVLAPHLWSFGVHPESVVIVTRRRTAGPNDKGGVTSWGQIERDLKLLLSDTSVVAVSTFLDYYGLPSDVPGMSNRPSADAVEAVRHVERSIDLAIGSPRVRSNLNLHEFEALLFADPDECGRYLGNAELASGMRAAVAACGGPELVNDDPRTAPSKRILALHPTYRKTADGPSLTEKIGLDAIRKACAHFDSWLDWLEAL
jgi:Domain of unknown function (DUF4276)